MAVVGWYRRVVRVVVLTMVGGLGGAAGTGVAAPAGVESTGSVHRVDRAAPVGAAARSGRVSRWAWGPSERVASRRASEEYARGKVRVRGRTVMAVWDARLVGRPGVTLLKVATRGSGGRWSRARTIARVPSRFLSMFDLALGPAGTALVVWEFGDGQGHLMETHREGGSWSRPRRLGDGTAGEPTGVIDGRGVMTIAWTSDSDERSFLNVSSRDPGRCWGAVKRLAGHGGGGLGVAANRRGDLVVAWGTEDGVGVAIRRHRTGWQRVRSHRSQVPFPEQPDVVLSPGGRVVVMWSKSSEDAFGSRRHLAWARTRFDGTWSRVRYLDTSSAAIFGTESSLSMNRHGRAVAVWMSGSDRGMEVRSSRFRFGHGWTRPRGLGQSCCAPHVMVTRSGTAVGYLGEADDSPATVVWAHQAPGRAWQRRTMPSTPDVIDAHGDGHRMVLLYNAPRLSARLLRVP